MNNVFIGGIGAVGFLPMDLEESILIIAKRHNRNIKDIIGILNALTDSKITDKDLELTPSKSSRALQDKLDKKTKEIWSKSEGKYQGNLIGNSYYSPLKDIIIFKILKRYRPYRKFAK
jgi:hypothetical protein